MNLVGKIEWCDGRRVVGWAAASPPRERPVALEVVVDGRAIATIEPTMFRWDLRELGYGEGPCGFHYDVDAQLRDGGAHELSIRFRETGVDLQESPQRLGRRDEDEFAPSAPVALTGCPALALAPHPDDEALGCGGALLLHRDRGDAVKVVFMTDGARADVRGEHDRAAYVELREREAAAACAAAGIADLEFWRLPDRALTAEEATVSRLAACIAAFRPGVVYAPSPLEAHPDHRAAAQILWQAAQRAATRFRIAFYEQSQPLSASALVDISAVVERKRAMCERYASQLGHRPYGELALGLNRYRALAPGPPCTHAEAFLLSDADAARRQALEALVLASVSPRRPAAVERALVSIVVRTRDRAALLRDALSSVVLQTYRPIEVIVVDDGGADVAATLADFEAFAPLRHIRHAQPRGRAAAANAGVRAARGTYVNLLDDDDVLYPEHTATLAGFLESTGRDFAYSDCDRGDYRWEEGGFTLSGPKRPFNGGDFDRDRLHFNNYIPVMTALFRRSLFDAVGGFDESFDFLEDWDLWLRMARRTDFCHLPVRTAEYRFHGDHSWDNHSWTLKVFDKYRDYWTPENLARATWPRIAEARREAQALRAQCSRAEYEAAEARVAAAKEAAAAREIAASLEQMRQRVAAVEQNPSYRLVRAAARVLPGGLLRRLGPLADRIGRR